MVFLVAEAFLLFYKIGCTNKGEISPGGSPAGLPHGAVSSLEGSPVGHHEGSHSAHQIVDCRGLEVQHSIYSPGRWSYPY